MSFRRVQFGRWRGLITWESERPWPVERDHPAPLFGIVCLYSASWCTPVCVSLCSMKSFDPFPFFTLRIRCFTRTCTESHAVQISRKIYFLLQPFLSQRVTFLQRQFISPILLRMKRPQHSAARVYIYVSLLYNQHCREKCLVTVLTLTQVHIKEKGYQMRRLVDAFARRNHNYDYLLICATYRIAYL